jgi:hypothetical protein
MRAIPSVTKAVDGTTFNKELIMGKVQTDKSQGDKMQGEGNYEAAEQFNKAEQAFIKSGKVALAAPHTAPKSPKEAQQLLQAEQDSQKSPKGALSSARKSAVKPSTQAKAVPRKM